jgi:hypothetical protein
MKKFIKSVGVFVVVAFVGYLVLLVIWGSFVPGFLNKNLNYKVGANGHMYSRIHEIKNVKDVDILFLGASLCYRGFDPRIFEKKGFRTFNLGSSAQTPIETEVLLKRYLDKINPKMIIYEVYPGILIDDGVESSLDIVANDQNDIESFKMALKLNHVKVYNTLLYSVFMELLNKNDSYVEDVHKGVDTYIPGGFVERKIKYYKNVKYKNNFWNLNDKQFTSFKNIISFIKKRNIRIILVRAPISNALYQSYSNNEFYDSTISKYGEFYNFNKIVRLDDSLNFYDSRHLNQTGVEIFNNKLIDTLFSKK